MRFAFRNSLYKIHTIGKLPFIQNNFIIHIVIGLDDPAEDIIKQDFFQLPISRHPKEEPVSFI